jgi:serine/threonine-protein kinase
MSTEEEQVRDLVHQMYERAENTPWSMSAEDIRSKRRKRHPHVPSPKMVALIAAAILLVAILLGAGIESSGRTSHPVVVASSTTTTTTSDRAGQATPVPNLIGLGEAQAESALTRVGLLIGRINAVASVVSAAGTVISQDPGPGSYVAPGSSVDLAVSSGS